MTLRCVLFGHSPPANTKALIKALQSDEFECRICRSLISWKHMPKDVQRSAEAARRRLAQQ